MSMSSIGPASIERRENLGDQVVEALRAAIITGQMEPGELYSSAQLAAQYGVSVTPVREALLALVREGLLETVRNKGFRVTSVSDADLDALVEVRRLLEVPAIVELARRSDRNAVTTVTPLLDDIRDAVERDDLVAYVEADRRFHAALIDLLGNPVLTATVDSLRVKTRLFGLRRLFDEHAVQRYMSEHEQLVQVIEVGDAEAARSLMEQHLAHARKEWAASGRPQPLDALRPADDKASSGSSEQS